MILRFNEAATARSRNSTLLTGANRPTVRFNEAATARSRNCDEVRKNGGWIIELQ